ncbi:conserved hypothetical protein [Burkholderiales bacterium 8X]|nr:conserved hypothetical protein [Burkholderiales bacterium 8X]
MTNTPKSWHRSHMAHRIAAAMLWLGMLLGGIATTARAQEADAGEMVKAALQAIQMIDQNKIGTLWAGATPAARKRVTEADFKAQVGKARTPLGAPVKRSWIGVGRQTVADADAELAGDYVSVEFESSFGSKPEAKVRELVTFHLDADRAWRFSGYVIR